MSDFAQPEPIQQPSYTVQDLVYLGFNSRVIALDRQTGDIVWEWYSPKGRGSYVAVLLDNDRLICSVQGYTYCLDPINGGQLWANPLKGKGHGIPSLTSLVWQQRDDCGGGHDCGSTTSGRGGRSRQLRGPAEQGGMIFFP